MPKHEKILAFIKEIRVSHKDMVSIFTQGSCLNFHCILKQVWKEVTPFFNHDHIITKIGDKYYDITGEVSCEGYLKYEDIFFEKEFKKSWKEMYYKK